MRTVLTARDAGHHRCQCPGLYRMPLQGPCIHRAGTGTRRVVWARKGPYLAMWIGHLQSFGQSPVPQGNHGQCRTLRIPMGIGGLNIASATLGRDGG